MNRTKSLDDQLKMEKFQGKTPNEIYQDKKLKNSMKIQRNVKEIKIVEKKVITVISGP